jgi:hypothetical protein
LGVLGGAGAVCYFFMPGQHWSLKGWVAVYLCTPIYLASLGLVAWVWVSGRPVLVITDEGVLHRPLGRKRFMPWKCLGTIVRHARGRARIVSFLATGHALGDLEEHRLRVSLGPGVKILGPGERIRTSSEYVCIEFDKAIDEIVARRPLQFGPVQVREVSYSSNKDFAKAMQSGV